MVGQVINGAGIVLARGLRLFIAWTGLTRQCNTIALLRDYVSGRPGY
jgi:hypothetical protein